MADFRQLAQEFVLADDEPKLTSLAQRAASEIQTAGPASNPVARWVESVQPWMPGSNGEDVTEDGEESTNWTARAKALEFLSRTLDYLGTDVLKPSQVKLLVTFFGAMFEIDHKAGILASSTALSRIVAMKSFDPQSADDIIQRVCGLKDDFLRQVAKTRLAIYELARSLITYPEVAADLQKKHGEGSKFILDLIQLCRSERDPDCLMVWFDTLRHFLVEYSYSDEVLEDVYGTFKPYFPITLPRIAQSGLTPDELKLQLRKCFSATQRLAKLSYPFLLGKLDQGDGVTVNVKIDVLKTIKACVEQYEDPAESVEPYVNRIWGSLKYEVRNGEIEDTIWATLEVLKAVATRLKGEALRDYTLTVTRDCVSDLTTPMYTAPAGRLLVSVLSANPSAYVLIAAPTITHIKENLRHPKSPVHTQDLLKVLHVVLETRVLLSETEMTSQESEDFKAIDPIIDTLYIEVYKSTLALGAAQNASYDDIKIATQAVQGVGSLVRQRPVKPDLSKKDIPSSETTYSKISDALIILAVPPLEGSSRSDASDELVNEALKALQQAVRVCPTKYREIVDSGMTAIQATYDGPVQTTVTAIQTYGSMLAFVGCYELAQSPVDSLNEYIYYVYRISREVYLAVNSGKDANILCALTAVLQSGARYFNDACSGGDVEGDESFDHGNWVTQALERYPILASLSTEAPETHLPESFGSSIPADATVTEVRKDFLLVSLFIALHLYQLMAGLSVDGSRLELNPRLAEVDDAVLLRLLHLVSGFAGFVLHEMSEKQQSMLQADELAFNLFSKAPVVKTSRWDWLVSGKLNVLCFGILEGLRPSVLTRLFQQDFIQLVILNGLGPDEAVQSKVAQPVNLAILAVLANKCKIETSEALMKAIEENLARALQTPDLARTTLAFAVANGLFRRYSGKQAQGLLSHLREAPKQPLIGYRLARRLEIIAVPHDALTKDRYAVVKPLWMQKVYFELVKPMLSAATGADPKVEAPLIKTNFSVAVLSMIKHMTFSIYEDDAEAVLRVCISVAQVSQSIGSGPDLEASMSVMKNIIAEASEKAQDHLRSIIFICIDAFSASRPSSAKEPPAWLPLDYAAAGNESEVRAACGKLGLDIVGGLPKIFEARHLVPFAPQVQRELTAACGHTMRDVRKSARLARAAWVDLK